MTSDQVGQQVGQVGDTVGNAAGGLLGGKKGGEEGGGDGKNEQLRLKLDLNLDIEIQLKAKIHGDLTLGLLYVVSFFIPPSLPSPIPPPSFQRAHAYCRSCMTVVTDSSFKLLIESRLYDRHDTEQVESVSDFNWWCIMLPSVNGYTLETSNITMYHNIMTNGLMTQFRDV